MNKSSWLHNCTANKFIKIVCLTLFVLSCGIREKKDVSDQPNRKSDPTGSDSLEKLESLEADVAQPYLKITACNFIDYAYREEFHIIKKNGELLQVISTDARSKKITVTRHIPPKGKKIIDSSCVGYDSHAYFCKLFDDGILDCGAPIFNPPISGFEPDPEISGTFKFDNPRYLDANCVIDNKGLWCFDSLRKAFVQEHLLTELNRLVSPSKMNSILPFQDYVNGNEVGCVNFTENNGDRKFLCLTTETYEKPIQKQGTLLRMNFRGLKRHTFYYKFKDKFFKEILTPGIETELINYEDCDLDNGVVKCPHLSTESYAKNVYLMKEVRVFGKIQTIIADQFNGLMTLDGIKIDIGHERN